MKAAEPVPDLARHHVKGAAPEGVFQLRLRAEAEQQLHRVPPPLQHRLLQRVGPQQPEAAKLRGVHPRLEVALLQKLQEQFLLSLHLRMHSGEPALLLLLLSALLHLPLHLQYDDVTCEQADSIFLGDHLAAAAHLLKVEASHG
eukprot:CAMPEP_0181409182 /NCGR_PEP_ID=MMETSP1110-20121109/6684_1 /TAXON_ID=174948 /ORGANISM="Symbiodinium sp., Strain CCMP421" /LENGTH=143 /DNA_ID=CAMNT_0023531675 /DNA_START=573 /DNA_END=1004 /DNA_ORIENTATION=+